MSLQPDFLDSVLLAIEEAIQMCKFQICLWQGLLDVLLLQLYLKSLMSKRSQEKELQRVLLLAFKLTKTTFTAHGGEIFYDHEEKFYPKGWNLPLQSKVCCPAPALCKK